MDTIAARTQMRELAERGLEVLQRYLSGEYSAGQANDRYRELLDRARGLLADAGYPGESAWRALQQAQGGTQYPAEAPDSLYWHDVADGLRESLDTLERLTSTAAGRDADFRIIG